MSIHQEALRPGEDEQAGTLTAWWKGQSSAITQWKRNGKKGEFTVHSG